MMGGSSARFLRFLATHPRSKLPLSQTSLPELFSWPSLAFSGFVLVMLVLDLTVFHRHNRDTTLREAAVWTAIWCSLALGFNALLWRLYGAQRAVEFLTGYLVEWSLSMDNVFVFAVIFAFFRVPKKYQYRVLFWGILGAIVMRLAFIAAGAALIKHFEWVMVVFGAILIFTAVKLAFLGDAEHDPERNLLMRMARKVFPVARGDHGARFFAREGGRLCITPLFLVLLVVESTDVMFAIDSVPAIFGITKEPFLVFTSNVFAILGLRALYFLLAGVMDMFRYLSKGLAAVLFFVGCKMTLEFFVHAVPEFHEWFAAHVRSLPDPEAHVISPFESLGVIALCLGISIAASIAANLRDRRRGTLSAHATDPHDPHKPLPLQAAHYGDPRPTGTAEPESLPDRPQQPHESLPRDC
jgi:tellurite resistance protein TerC